MTSQLNDLKSQHIADEVKKVDDKVNKNITDILNAKTSLEHDKSVTDDLERESSFNRGFYYYNQQSYFLSESKSKSFTKMEELFMHGYQQEFIMTVIIQTYFM